MAISNPSSVLSWRLVVSIIYIAVTATRAIEHSPQQNYYQIPPGSSANSTDLFDKVSSLLDSYPVERVNLHCARTPPNLQALCGASLGWAPQMRLPNLLGHRTVEELDRVTFMSPEPEALHYLIHTLAKGDVECKGLDQLRLLVCATVAPHCLDVLIPPCRQLCLRAKQGCRLTLQRLGIDWPRFLDCRQFPSMPQDICIGRQPRLIDHNVVQQPKARGYRNETLDVASTMSSGIASTTMTSTTTTRNEQSAGPTATSKRRRKDKKQRRKTTTTTTTTTTPSPASETTAEPIAKDNDPTATSTSVSSEQPAATNKMILSNLTPPPTQASNESFVDLTPSATIATTPVNINTIQQETTTTQDVSPTSDNMTAPITVPTETTTTTTTSLITSTSVAPVISSITNGDVIRMSEDPITMAPVTTTSTAANDSASAANDSAPSPHHDTVINHEDLGRNLCWTRPDWLIKAKLTDNQLMNAVRRHKFGVRSYRRIFGSFPNNTRQVRYSASGGSPRNSPATISVDLSNSTWLYFPKSSDGLMGQPIGNLTYSRHEAADSPSFGDTNMTNSRTYLIFGTSRGGEESSTLSGKTVTYIVAWPNAAALKDSSPVKESSNSIVKVYKGFKLRGASFCAQYQQSDSSWSSEQRQAANVSSNGDNFMSHSLKPGADSWHQVAKPVTSTTVTHPAVMADDTAMTLASASTSTTARPVAVRTRKHQQQPTHHRKQTKSPAAPTAAASQ